MAKAETDVAASTKDRDLHRGMAKGTLNALVDRYRAFLGERQGSGTRIHREDASKINDLLYNFELEMCRIIRCSRDQQRPISRTWSHFGPSKCVTPAGAGSPAYPSPPFRRAISRSN
jgi:hypothetical protein